MVEIIKRGKDIFKMECPFCDARFSYAFTDIRGIGIQCPCCGYITDHLNHETDEGDNDQEQFINEIMEKTCNDCMRRGKCPMEPKLGERVRINCHAYLGDPNQTIDWRPLRN